MTAGDRLVVGFDLDMTLVDSSRSIVTMMQRTLAVRSVIAREEQLWPLIGAPLEDNLAVFLPAEQVAQAARDYRADYLVDAVQWTVPMPGARALVDAIHAAGGTVLVVSAKAGAAVAATLRHVGIEPDVVVGDLFGPGKAAPLVQHRATAYVGDHPGDMQAAATAGVRGVGVASGPTGAEQLRAAGADLVAAELGELVARLTDLSGP